MRNKKKTENKQTNNPLVSSEKIFTYAAQFEYAMRVLSVDTNKRAAITVRSGSAKTSFPCFLAGVVYDAFAIELYLKCLFRIERNANPPHGHHLLTFYNMLSAPRRQRIKEIYVELIKNSRHANAVMSHQKNPHLYDFDRVIQEASNAFITFRYGYEDPSKLMGYFAQQVRDAARMAILEIHPEFSAILENIYNTAPPKWASVEA